MTSVLPLALACILAFSACGKNIIHKAENKIPTSFTASYQTPLQPRQCAVSVFVNYDKMNQTISKTAACVSDFGSAVPVVTKLSAEKQMILDNDLQELGVTHLKDEYTEGGPASSSDGIAIVFVFTGEGFSKKVTVDSSETQSVPTQLQEFSDNIFTDTYF